MLDKYRQTEHVSGLSLPDLIYELVIGVSVVLILIAGLAALILLLDRLLSKKEA